MTFCALFSRTLLSLALASLAVQTHAANDAVLSTTASLGVLQYRLIDLNPNDGVQAKVTFAPAGTMRVYAFEDKKDYWSRVMIEQESLDRTGVPFSDALSGSIQFTDGRASAAVAAGQINSKSVYDAERVAAMVPAVPVGGGAEYGYREYRQDAGGRLGLQYTLTPNTRIEFSASGTLGQLADLTSLKANSVLAPVTVELRSSIGGLILGTAGTASDVFLHSPYLNRKIELDASGAVLSDETRGIPTVSFSLISSNLGRTALTNTLEINAFSSVTYSFFPRAPIPEPGTWALMALGLAGVACATRQRRAAALG